MNKIILGFFVAVFSVSTISAHKNQTESKKNSNTKYDSRPSLNEMAKTQQEGIMEQAPTEYIGNSELGTSTYDQKITNLDQTLDLEKTRNTLKSESEKTNTRNVILILLTLLVGFVIGIFVKKKE